MIATEDIRNAQGQLVVPKGQAIDSNAASRVVKFKLLKPIEASVSIENELNAESLQKSILDYLAADPGLQAIMTSLDGQQHLTECCSVACKQTMMRQKLTVLSMQLPETYKQALFCAWLGMLVMRERKAGDGDIRKFFIAALAHDFGQLHISTEVFNKKEELTPEEIRQLHAHPVIGQKILQAMGASSSICKAVLNHHETLDGAGFPMGKYDADICEWGSLLYAIDSAYAIYHKHFKPLKKSIADIVPVLQMSARSKFTPVAQKMFFVLKHAKPSVRHTLADDQIHVLILDIKNRHAYVSAFFEVSKSLITEIGFKHNNKKMHALQNAFFGLHMAMTESGLINDAYMRWLDQMEKGKVVSAYKEAEDVLMMLEEVVFFINGMSKQISVFITEDSKPDIAQVVEKISREIEKIPVPEKKNVLHQ